MTRYALLICATLCAVSFAIGFIVNGLALVGVAATANGLLWMYAWRRGTGWLSMASLVLSVLTAVGGIMVGVHTGWALAGVTSALFAWDLIEFQSRLGFVHEKSDTTVMEKRHILRLIRLAVVVAILYLLTVVIRLKVGLWVVIVLSFIFALGLVQLLFRLRAERTPHT